MWERLRRFSALEAGARGIFLRAALLLPLISLSLRMRGFGATQGTLQKFLPSLDQQTTTSRGPNVDLIARMVRAAVHHGVGHPTCLEESLALWWLLGRRGIASQLRIGIKKQSPKFEAHAWVELGGAPLNEPETPHQHYAAFEGEISAVPPEQR
jgi:Transglutaminase-like superfamily